MVFQLIFPDCILKSMHCIWLSYIFVMVWWTGNVHITLMTALYVYFVLFVWHFQLWMSFSSIADSTAIYFDIDQMQVNWLSIVFMIATIVIGIGAIWILDHCGLRTTVILTFAILQSKSRKYLKKNSVSYQVMKMLCIIMLCKNIAQ